MQSWKNKLQSSHLQKGASIIINRIQVGSPNAIYKCSRCKWVGEPDYMINTFDLPVGVFDMPNPYRYSIFDRYRYFAKFPYPYRYQEFTKARKEEETWLEKWNEVLQAILINPKLEWWENSSALEQHSFQGRLVSVCKLQVLQLFWRRGKCLDELRPEKQNENASSGLK